MKITKEELQKAVDAHVLESVTSENLWNWLESQTRKSSLALDVLLYVGALTTISAMTWFATRAFSEANPVILLVTGSVYLVVFSMVGHILRGRLVTQLPSALLLTIAVFMVPLTIFAIQRTLGFPVVENPGSYREFFTWVNKGWFWMEAGTVVVSGVYLLLYRFQFLTFPLAFTLWFLSLDLTPFLFGADFSWDRARLVSTIFGLCILVVSYILDLVHRKRDYSFWLYLFGLMAFWSGISFSSTDQLLLKFLYLGVNVLLGTIGVAFRRPVFLVFGGLGVFAFLYDITNNVFRDSLMFPIYLSLIGVSLVSVGIILIRKRDKIEKRLSGVLPGWLKAIVPRR